MFRTRVSIVASLVETVRTDRLIDMGLRRASIVPLLQGASIAENFEKIGP